MADDKRRDYTIEMSEKGSAGTFEAMPAPPPPTRQALATSSIANNGVVSIACYCGASILMTCVNKYVVNGRDFNMSLLMLFVQCTVCTVAITAAKFFGLISFRDYNNDEARKWLPIAVLLVGMISTGIKAIQFLSIPVYTIFKNLTIILIAYGEVLWFGGSVTGITLLSFGLMVLSSVIAAWADIQHALTSYNGDSVSGEAAEKIAVLNAGYLWMLMNCFCSASFVLGMRKRIKLTNFKDFDTMFYNNLLSMPILLIGSVFLEDWSAENLALNFPEGEKQYMILAMIFTGMSSIFISYASAWCVRVTSSTTYSMVGALNKLPIAISGLIFFDAPITLPSVSAIALGFVSGLVYALAKMRPKKADGAGILPTTSASSQSMRDSLKS